MPISVQLRDEHGVVSGQIDDEAVELTRALPPTGDPDFPMLGLIDPYGNTWFSPMQMRAVVPEIRRLRALLPNPPEVLDDLEDLALVCAEEPHVFLVFIGD